MDSRGNQEAHSRGFRDRRARCTERDTPRTPAASRTDRWAVLRRSVTATLAGGTAQTLERATRPLQGSRHDEYRSAIRSRRISVRARWAVAITVKGNGLIVRRLFAPCERCGENVADPNGANPWTMHLHARLKPYARRHHVERQQPNQLRERAAFVICAERGS